jgi:maltose-binding protein MalE
LLATIALTAGACTSDTATDAEAGSDGTTGTAEPVTLDFWVFKEIESGAFYDTLVAEFEAAHPNIDVELTSYPEDNYDVKIDTAVAADKAPDLMVRLRVRGSDLLRRLLPRHLGARLQQGHVRRGGHRASRGMAADDP